MYLGVPNILSTELWDKISIIAAKEMPTSISFAQHLHLFSWDTQTLSLITSFIYFS